MEVANFMRSDTVSSDNAKPTIKIKEKVIEKVVEKVVEDTSKIKRLNTKNQEQAYQLEN